MRRTRCPLGLLDSRDRRPRRRRVAERRDNHDHGDEPDGDERAFPGPARAQDCEGRCELCEGRAVGRHELTRAGLDRGNDGSSGHDRGERSKRRLCILVLEDLWQRELRVVVRCGIGRRLDGSLGVRRVVEDRWRVSELREPVLMRVGGAVGRLEIGEAGGGLLRGDVIGER
jgi:hypothetical protein